MLKLDNDNIMLNNKVNEKAVGIPARKIRHICNLVYILSHLLVTLLAVSQTKAAGRLLCRLISTLILGWTLRHTVIHNFTGVLQERRISYHHTSTHNKHVLVRL